MRKKQAERNSSLELLRILCILAIIGDHFVGQSGIAESGSLPGAFFYTAVISLSRVACSVYIIISAWFLVDRDVQIKRVFHVWLTVVMYTVPIMAYMYYIGLAGKEDLLRALLPVEESPLWFAGYYILLILTSPVLNLLLRKENRRIAEYVIFVLLVLNVLYPTITARLGFFSNDLFALIFLYLLTGYIKKYRDDLPNAKKCMAVFFAVWGSLTVLRALARINGSSRLYIWTLIGEYGEVYRARLQTLPNLAQAYCLFFAFKGIKLKNSKLINTAASATLGVYCFHQVPVWYGYLWKNIFHTPFFTSILHGKLRMLYTLGSILTVWLCGTVIELIRSRLSGAVIESRAWYGAMCRKIDDGLRFSIPENSESTERPSSPSMRKVAKYVLIGAVIYFSLVNCVVREHYWIRPLNADLVRVEELDFHLEADVAYTDGLLTGTVTVTNDGEPILAPSTGARPINLGISVVDADGNMIEQDYLHTAIKSAGILKSGESQPVEIELTDLAAYAAEGNGIRFEILQENVGWLDDTAVYYWFGEGTE